LCLAQALRLDETLQGLEAPPAGRDLKQPGFGAQAIEHGPDVQALKEAAPADVLGQVVETDASLDLADICSTRHELVEGDVARAIQHEFRCGGCHRV